MVEATGFEHATSASRTQRSTKLSHASIYVQVVSHGTVVIIADRFRFVKRFFAKKKNIFVRRPGAVCPLQGGMNL